MPEESDECARLDRTPPPPTLSPAAITVGRGEDLTSEHPLLGEETKQTAVVGNVLFIGDDIKLILLLTVAKDRLSLKFKMYEEHCFIKNK